MSYTAYEPDIVLIFNPLPFVLKFWESWLRSFQIKPLNSSLGPFVPLSILNSWLFGRVHGMHAMRVTNFPHLNHLKEIYLASISSNRCSASSRSKSKIKKPIRKMPKPRIFPRFCKCWNLKKKEKGERKTVVRDRQTVCTIGPTTRGESFIRTWVAVFVVKVIRGYELKIGNIAHVRWEIKPRKQIYFLKLCCELGDAYS